jgi:tripartite-type tricarboxylate transporter receptor subunit TctC
MSSFTTVRAVSTKSFATGLKARCFRVMSATGVRLSGRAIGSARSIRLGDVPTFREAGYPVEAAIWFGVYAPGRTPSEVIARLNEIIVAALQTQEIRSRMLALGLHPTGTSSVELAKIQQADFERWGPIIRASGFKPDQ